MVVNIKRISPPLPLEIVEIVILEIVGIVILACSTVPQDVGLGSVLNVLCTSNFKPCVQEAPSHRGKSKLGFQVFQRFNSLLEANNI